MDNTEVEEFNRLQPLNEGAASRTVMHYVCAACWGHLLKRPAPKRMYIVYCPHCGEDGTTGYVTRAFAQRQLSASAEEMQDVKHTYTGIILPTPKKEKPDDILKQLGF